MATSNSSKVSLVSLDFDALKASLISFLKGQSQFADYNFTGSTLNTIIDLLVYNTHYQSFYLNMIANESFLDTAVLRSTVVSHAKELGYTPRSVVTALATVNVAITKSNTDSTATLTLPRFTQFSSSALDGKSYNFVTLDDVNVPASGNVFNFNGLTIKEGSPTVKTFIVDNKSNPTQMFNLTDANVDVSTIQVIVQQSLTNQIVNTFTLAEDATSVTSDSNVYFIEEGQNGNYVIYFGDGVIGRKLDDNNVLIISYLVTNAESANFLNTFTLQTVPLSGGTANVTTINASAGGSPVEDVASIKFSAPKSYIAQNRAVTKNDYVTLINKKYPYFDAINIWGGEEVNPPVYGKVFISAKPKSGYAVTTQQQQYLIDNIIRPISVLTVTPEFVETDYNYIILNLRVEYDSKQTTLSPIQLKNNIITSIYNYAALNLNTFNSEFRLSRLLRAIDDTDVSVLSSTAEVKIQKRFNPTLGRTATYTLNTGCSLHHGVVNNRLTSDPAFGIEDVNGVVRQAFFEEIPSSYDGIDEVLVFISGSNYIAPNVTIIGDGTGANAYPVVVNGKIKSVIIDKIGSGYSTAIATVTDDSGSGAVLQVGLQGTLGSLRTYYFDAFNNKVILNVAAGTIDYINGIVTISDFQPVSVANDEGRLDIQLEPDFTSGRLTSNFNRIVTLDPNDENAISIVLTDVNNQ